MKRIFNIALITISILLIALLVFYSNDKDISDSMYVIEEMKGYVIDHDRRMVLEVYSNNPNSLIKSTKRNSYIFILNDLEWTLNNVVVQENKAYQDLYLYKIEADIIDIPKNELSGEAYLKIINNSYEVKFKLGTFSFLKPTMPLLKINYLSVSDSFINKHLNIVGLNIELVDKYSTMNSLRMGSFAYGSLDLAISDTRVGNVCDIKELCPMYRATTKSDKELKLKGGKYFIPITYDRVSLIRETYIIVRLDGKDYYLDTFSFKPSDIDISLYKNDLVKGEINYARGK